MFRVTQEILFCYGHRLLHHAGRCKRLHGHNAVVHVTVEGDRLDDAGMLIDFHEIKNQLGRWIDETLDHRMILWQDDPLVSVLQASQEPIVLMAEHPTAENLARWIAEKGCEFGLPVVETQLWETQRSSATWTV